MDFKNEADRTIKWVGQLKDHFSRMVFLFPLASKHAEPIAQWLIGWMADHGHPNILQVGTTFVLN